VRHLDRLTRADDPRERYAIFGAVMDAGATIVDAGGHVIDPMSEVGELDFAFQSIMAARERRLIVKRTDEARKRLAAEGKLQGRAPFGRRWFKRTGEWSEDPGGMETYRRIFADVLAGKSLHEIAQALNAEGKPTPGASWKRRTMAASTGWSAANVGYLIRHPSAVGKVTSNGEPIPGCPPVVSPEEYERACRLLNASNLRAGRPATSAGNEALLRKVAVCGECGGSIWVQRGGRKGAWSYFYVCRRFRDAEEEGCRRWHSVRAVDEVLKRQLIAWRDGRLPAIAGKVASVIETSAPEDEVKRTTAALKLLDRQEENFARLVRKMQLSERAARKQSDEITRERSELEARLATAKLRIEAREREAEASGEGEKAVARVKARMRVDMPFIDWRAAVEALLPRGAATLHADGKLALRLGAP